LCTSNTDCENYSAFCESDGLCYYSTEECDGDDPYTCSGLDNYCEGGTCVTRDCNNEECPKILSPSWTYEQNDFILYRDSSFSLDANDFIEDPTEDVDLELTIEIALGASSLYLSEEDGVIT
jgi:hypothetical protein